MHDLRKILDMNCIEKRKVYLWGDIDENSTIFVIETLQYLAELNSDPITIYINSHGGSVDAAVTLIDEMTKIQNEGIIVKTKVLGCAYSAAGSILTLGSPGYRSARPNSSIMLHPCSYELNYDYGGYQQKVMSFMYELEERINRLIAKACGMNSTKQYKAFIQDIDKGLWLSAEQALSYGMIDEIERGINVKNTSCKKSNFKRRV